MPILFICRDVDESEALRAEHRDAHFAYIESIMSSVLIAGPLGAGAPAGASGSLFAYATDDRATAKRLLHNDPYYLAGVYAEVEAHDFLPAAGEWIGGAIWQQ